MGSGEPTGGGIDHADPVVARIGDVDPAVRTDGDREGEAEHRALAWPVAESSLPGPRERRHVGSPARLDPADPVIIIIMGFICE